MSEDREQFAIVRRSVIESPAWQSADATMLRCYAAIALRADRHGKACISIDDLRNLLGLSETATRNVQRAVARLVDAGLLDRDAGGGRGRPTRYRLETPAHSAGLYGPETPAQDDRVSDAKPRRTKAETPAQEGINPGAQRRTFSNTAYSACESEHRFPTKAGDDWTLDADRLAEYRSTFPGIDIDAELRKARLWLLDNPGRQKTPKGMPRFLSGWLTRAKPNDPGTTRNGDGYPTTEDLDRVCPLVEPSEEDFAAVAAELAREDAQQ